jgi:hypothetical protein
MIRRGGLSYEVTDELASFFAQQRLEAIQRAELRSAARQRREGGTQEVDACSPPGGERSMKAPDPASHTEGPSALDERGELG